VPWLAAGVVVLLWAFWTVAPWFRRGDSTNHAEIHGSAVTSIQEIALSDPPDNIAELYFRRLRRLGGYLLWQTRWSPDSACVKFLPFTLIRFGATRREDDREVLTVANAIFSRHGGTLAFVRKGGRVRVELRGFRPRVAMPIYEVFQLPIHAALSRSFLAWLARRPRGR
jgi:hypothetical protein